jgi:hypothetical protein
MITRRIILASAAALALAPGARGSPTRLEGGRLRSDAAILRRAFETMHPGLLRYNSARRMENRFEAFETAWSRDQTLAEAYLSVSGFLSEVRCGHTYANHYNQSDAVHAELFAGPDKLPFLFRWMDGRMIVTGQGGDALPAGSEILTVNGERPQQILKQLLRYVRADGSNDPARISLLEPRGLDQWETFDIFYALTHPEARSGFEVEARRPDGKRTGRLSLAPIDVAARRAQGRKPPPAADGAPGWTISFGDDRVCKLTMPSWVVYNTKWDWRGFLDQAFADMDARGTRGLIVDLRTNGGGNDCGDDILARLIDADLQRPAYERRVRYRKAPEDLLPYLDTWDPSFRDWGDSAQSIDERFYRLIDENGQSRPPITPRGPRFRGRMAVIIGPENSSATFQFAALVRRERLGVLVGRPTGGNLRGINGGGFFFLRLPGSGIEVDLPLIGTFPATPQPDGGVAPDVNMLESAADIAAGRDSLMEAARAAIA